MKKLPIILCLLISNILMAQMPNTISKTDKIYGLSKFWQEVNYNFSFLYKVDREQWDADYKKLIEEVQETKNDYEYYRLLEKFCATLKDGHTNIFYPAEIQKNILHSQFGDYYIYIRNIENKAIIARINKSKKDELPIGTEVIEVNGLKTKEHIEQFVKPYFSSSTTHILEEFATARLFKAERGTSFNVKFKLPNGEVKDIKLTLNECEDKELYPAVENRPGAELKWMGDGVAYLGLHSFDKSDKADSIFDALLPQLYKAKKLIIDLRYNGGGSTSVGFHILQYLTNDNHLYGLRLTSRIHSPAYKAWGKWTSVNDTAGNPEATKEYLSHHDMLYEEIPIQIGKVNIDEPRIVVPTVLLMGHFTASSAEDFLLFCDNQEHMITIGEPSYGSTGQPLFFKLPGGGSARVCTLKNTYTDGREFVGIGVLPDITIGKTLKDHLENNDPVLDKALDYLKKN